MTNRKKSVFSVTAVLGAVLSTALLLTGCADENNGGKDSRNRNHRNDAWAVGPMPGQGMEIKRAKGTSMDGDEVRIFLYSAEFGNNGGVYPRNGVNQGFNNHQNYDPRYGNNQQNYDPRFGMNNHIPNTVGPVTIQAVASFSTAVNLNRGYGTGYGAGVGMSYGNGSVYGQGYANGRQYPSNGRNFHNGPCYIYPGEIVNFQMGQIGQNGRIVQNGQFEFPYFDGYRLEGDFALIGRGAGMVLELRPARTQALYYGMGAGNFVQISNSASSGQPTLFGNFEVRRVDQGQFCQPKQISLYDAYQ